MTGQGQPEIRPGVAAVLRDSSDRLLLHRRRVGLGWAPPSGSVEPGESLLTAVKREIAEETRLITRIERLVGVYSDPAYQIIRYPNGRLVHFVTTLFVGRVGGGRLEGSNEGLVWRWFAPESLPSGLLPYAEVWLADALADDQSVVVR